MDALDAAMWISLHLRALSHQQGSRRPLCDTDLSYVPEAVEKRSNQQGHLAAHNRSMMTTFCFGGARRGQGEPGGAMSQEEPGGARRSREEPGGARRSQEEPGRARKSQEEPGGARRSQEEDPGRARRSQEELGARRSQKEHPRRSPRTTWGHPGGPGQAILFIYTHLTGLKIRIAGKGLEQAVSSHFIAGELWEPRPLASFPFVLDGSQAFLSLESPVSPAIPRAPQLSSYLILGPAYEPQLACKLAAWVERMVTMRISAESSLDC